MAKDLFYTGIDLGTSKVSTLVARVGPEGGPQVVGVGVASSEGIEKGMVVNIREAAEAVHTSVEEARRYVGHALSPAYVSISGTYLSCVNSTGALNGNGSPLLFSTEEVRELIRSSYPALDPDKEVLHIIPRDFVVDGLKGIRNPVGLQANEARVESTVVVGESAALRNVRRAVEKGGATVRALVMGMLAASDAVLTEDEKELGVVLVDLGGGTTDIGVFKGGALCYSACIPVGGYQVSRDLSVALGIPYYYAEEAKLRWGCALPDMVDASEEVLVPSFRGGARQTVKRRELCEPIWDRLQETIRLVFLKLRQAGLERFPAAGLVLTGGSASMPGMLELVKKMMPGHVRIGVPKPAQGLPAEMRSPAFAASVGILFWGMRHQGEKGVYRRAAMPSRYAVAFRSLRSAAGAQWRGTYRRLAAEFKRIYA